MSEKEYYPPDARVFDADFDYEASRAMDIPPAKPIQELARTETSRRTFIKGAIAAGAVVSTAGYVFRGAKSAKAQGAGGAERLVTVNVNGQDRRVDVMPQETLLHTLRYKLNLTGSKLGCDRGECGACTVHVDGTPVYGCSVLTHSVRGKKVTTIEGIRGKDGGLHPVQTAMVKELAPQCGFCTSGQVMSAVALLNKNPKPTRDQVRHGMSGNLCRCGAYDHYTNAVLRASREA
jgi:aerobic-type carbon monoxide dehydrogenase small subunit (CoxS/CutS family)